MVPSVVPGLVKCGSAMTLVIVSAEATCPDVLGGMFDFGQSEIENLDMPALGDKNIRGLDVTVHDSLGVRGVEAVCNFNGESEHGIVIERFFGNQVLERRAIEKFHGNERLLVVFADLVNRADIWMVQRGSGTRLPAKALQSLRIAREFVG